VIFTDGICQKCAARVRADHLRPRFDHRATIERREAVWAPGLAALSLAVVVALVLVARPTHELPAPPVIAVLPPPVVEPAQEPSSRAVRLPAAPRAADPAPQVIRILPPPTSLGQAARRTEPRPLALTDLDALRVAALPRRAVVMTAMKTPLRIVSARDNTQSP
jgi:hypothetical protein